MNCTINDTDVYKVLPVAPRGYRIVGFRPIKAGESYLPAGFNHPNVEVWTASMGGGLDSPRYIVEKEKLRTRIVFEEVEMGALGKYYIYPHTRGIAETLYLKREPGQGFKVLNKVSETEF